MFRQIIANSPRALVAVPPPPFTQARIDSSAAITSDNTTLIHTEYDLLRDSCPGKLSQEGDIYCRP